MKILIVTQYYWPEYVKVNDLAKELKLRGHEVTVYTGLPNYPQGTFYKGFSILKGPYRQDHEGVDVIRIPHFCRGKGLGVMLALNYASFAVMATLLAPFRVRGHYDKIFVYQLSPVFAALPAVFLRFLKKAPLILWVTDLWPESLQAANITRNPLVLGPVRAFVKYLYKFSDRIYISSRGFRDRILAMGAPAEKIRFWPQWAEALFDGNVPIPQVQVTPAIPENGFVMMVAGNMGSSQDMPTLIQAMDLVRERQDIHLVLLGDGVMREWCLMEVEKRGLSATVHLVGKRPVEEMPYFYGKADAMLVSLTDTDLFSITLPGRLQSYMASGKPILASLSGEGGDLVREWNAGLSCPAGRPVELAATILKFASLPERDLGEMGRNAYDCYKTEFAREKLINILEEEMSSLRL